MSNCKNGNCGLKRYEYMLRKDKINKTCLVTQIQAYSNEKSKIILGNCDLIFKVSETII